MASRKPKRQREARAPASFGTTPGYGCGATEGAMRGPLKGAPIDTFVQWILLGDSGLIELWIDFTKGAGMSVKKTAIITGASQGIGAGLVEAFLADGYNVVATSRHITKSLTASPSLVLVDGDIGVQQTAANIVEAAMNHFESIDVLVNNAGIYLAKPFIEFTTEDFNALVSTNLLGFLYITQLAVKQMLKQKSGSVISITTTMADHPIAPVNASVSMITKGGLNSATRNLAIEYAKDGIRFNAVAPGVVDTPMHADGPNDFTKSLQPMGKVVSIKDITDAVLYLAKADQVTGEVLHVDGGAHTGRW